MRLTEQEAIECEEQEQWLVERAQQGDTEAFGELIGLHRSKAKELAERITRDPHLADDIVQDALIRAFLHLGSLSDTSRFLPWLNRIVRNQANMKLRRGGPNGKERPFTSMAIMTSDGAQLDWDDLDSILYHLSWNAASKMVNNQDPEDYLLRKELLETIHDLLHCLSPKERSIFQDYFFRQLGPEEIASIYHMTTGSIYTYIYRSRQKLHREHARQSLSLIQDKEEVGKKTMLPLPGWSEQPPIMSTIVDSVSRMLTSLGDQRTVAEWMGMSTIAFRMKISRKTTYADGIYIFDWRQVLQDWMGELGYEMEFLCGRLASLPVPLLGVVERFTVVLQIEEVVLSFIRKNIDLGKPILYFDTEVEKPYVHEWSVIHGYDDEQRVVYLTDQMKSEGKTLSYDAVIDNPIRFLAVINRKSGDVDDYGMKSASASWLRTQRIIRFAVNYAINGCDYVPKTTYLSYSSGLATYDCWLHHLQTGFAPNRYGFGQLTAVYTETKRYAAEYLQSIQLEGEAMRLMQLAARAYEETADALATMSTYVSFTRSSEGIGTELRRKCSDCLEKAKIHETTAVHYLMEVIAYMD